jgi:hypothetical protein
MADTQEFLDEVLGIFMGEIGLTRSRVEHGYIKPAEAYTENEKTKGKVQQAILQHFQQEQERKTNRQITFKNVEKLQEYVSGAVASFIRDHEDDIQKHPIDYDDHWWFIKELYLAWLEDDGVDNSDKE